MHQARKQMLAVVIVVLLICGSASVAAGEKKKAKASTPNANSALTIDALSAMMVELQAQLREQQAKVEQLSAELAEQQGIVAKREPSQDAQVACYSSAPSSSPSNAPTQQDVQQYTTKVEELGKKVDSTSANLGGFKLSGDFRFRLDGQLRSGNDIAPPLQNVRSRYRVRLNADKELDSKFKFHLQLSTGPYNVGTTNDQDMAGTIAKHPFSIAEAYVDYHPSPLVSIRGGRMEEVFADNMRFLWDDDVRFNGFQQIVTIPFGPNAAGFKSLELRAGEYFLSNPNVAILSSTSPFVAAGFQTGQKVRDTNLFHPGVLLKQSISKAWSHQFGGDFQFYRNPNQIQLASTANGFPVLVNSALGIALSGPMSASGNATTTAGGAIFSAPDFHVVRATYRLQYSGITWGRREMPLYFDVQSARNTGAPGQRDAIMGSINFGSVRNTGDLRLLYQFGLKQANSMISQFTDDDLGTGSGVNIRVHAIRADVGLTRFLQWQNLLFVQNEISGNNPAHQFFIPLQAGAQTTYRYLGQLSFTF